MKSKIKKTYIIILALCCVAFAALELYVQSDAFSLRIRQYVVGPLQDLLGPDAQIGFVKANFFPPYLEVHDIVLPDSRGNIVASIRRITVYINPLPLVVKKIWLPSISILEPRVHTERSVDGTLTLMPLVDRIKSNIARMSSRGPSEFGLQLRTISIYKGEILFQDDALSTKVAITDVNITSGVNLVGNKVRVNIRGARVRFTAPAYPELNGVLKASVDYDRGWVRLHSFELLTGDAACSFRGVVGPLPDATLDLRGKVRFGPQTISKFTDILKSTPKQRGSRVEASITARGKIIAPEILGDVSFSGLTYQGMTLQDAALSFQYRDHALSVGGDNWRVSWNKKTFLIDRITSSLAYRHGTLDIEHFEVIAGDLAVRMSGTLDPSTGFKTHLATESSGAGRTLSSIVPLPIEGAMKVEGNLTGALKTPVFDGSIDAGPLRVRGVHFSDIRGRLEYANNKIILSSVEIRRPSSHYVLDGSVDLINAELVYSARLRVIQSDVVSVLAMFHQDLPLRLSVSGELSFQGTARSYTGNGSLFFGEGSAYGESFTHGSVTALLSTGKISFPQVVLYKKHGLVEGTGWIAFDGSYSAALACRELSLAMIDHLDGILITDPSRGGLHL